MAICGRRAAPLRAVAAETGAFDLVCDVGDAGAVTRLVEQVTGKFGRLDGLVLNAGVMARPAASRTCRPPIGRRWCRRT